MKQTSRIFNDLVNAGYDPLDLAMLSPGELHALHAKEYPVAPRVIYTATANGGKTRKVA